MAEYERSRLVQASPDEVFGFVSDASNLATILPTVDTVEPQAEDRVAVHGEVRGRTYEDDGWFRVDEARRRIEWGADEGTYSGWLTVSGEDGGAQVVAHLSFAPYITPAGRPISGEPTHESDPIEQSLEAALDSLRNLMEGRGGKEEPAAAG
jgi:Polyketide cyclase / dehydrase and lipid transport